MGSRAGVRSLGFGSPRMNSHLPCPPEWNHGTIDMLRLRLILAGALLAATLPAATCPPKVDEFRDAQNRVAGTIRTQGDCTVEARDFAGRLLGRYDPRNRQMRDAQGRLFSTGNTLPALIWTAGGQTNSRSMVSKCRYCNSTRTASAFGARKRSMSISRMKNAPSFAGQRPMEAA